MNNRYKYILIGLVLFGGHQVIGQTSNYGELTVTSNTVLSITDDFTNDGAGVLQNDGELYFNQGIENNGVFNNTFNVFTGMVGLTGALPQSITGTSSLILNDLLIDNTSGIVNVQNVIRINGAADFSEGILTVDGSNGALFFEKDAEQLNASNFSHVDGKQHKVGDRSFIFPSGNLGSYRPSEISSPDVVTDNFSCEYLLENSDAFYPHANVTGIIETINDTEYWEINRELGSSEVVIGLSYESGVTSDFILNNLDIVHVVRWDETSNEWISEGGVHDASASMIYTVAEVERYGIYTLAVMDSELANEEIIAYNLLTPNGNGQNDYVIFDGLENFEDNSVTIVNRWGESVFEMDDYDNATNVFAGYANMGLTNTSSPLPDGTYFYVVRYTNKSGIEVKKVGYIHLANN